MSDLPAAVAAFLAGKRIAVAGVSRETRGHVGNAIFNKLRKAGYDAFAVNPNAAEIEGVKCYPAIGAIPGEIDGVIIATPPNVAACIVRQCAEKGVKQVWFHRAIGQGSVSDEALSVAADAGIAAIASGCPMMYVAPVDGAHRFFCTLLTLLGRLPK
jgi:predicted CoA-binding protein